MRNIDESLWLERPQLQIVQNKSDDKAAGLSQFILSVRQKRPQQADTMDEQEQDQEQDLSE